MVLRTLPPRAARTAAPRVRQCAWCGRVMDGQGRYTLAPSQRVAAATHGICPSCKQAMLDEALREPR